METKYADLWKKLEDLRKSKWISQKKIFAQLIWVTAQSITRWESWESRPEQSILPTIFAVLWVEDQDLKQEIFLLGWYVTNHQENILVISPKLQPLPLEYLDPYDFQRFSTLFLNKLFPTATVHPYWWHWHKQDWIDIEVTFKNNDIFTFQCKREKQFWPAKIEEAVSENTRPWIKNYILLSRIASPEARKKIKEYPTWDIWDVEDISQKLRSDTNIPDQATIVDTCFGYWNRKALLGIDTIDIWKTPEQFYATFNDINKVFNHAWNIIGREAELEAFKKNIPFKSGEVYIISGNWWSGKTRLVKSCIEQYVQLSPETIIRFLSPSEPPTSSSLNDLWKWAKLLIIDDAHERDDLEVLYQYIWDVHNNASLLLVSRTYWVESIVQQAWKYSLDIKPIISLKTLDEASLRLLSQSILDKFSIQNSAFYAENIIKIVWDSVLGVVLWSRTLAFANDKDLLCTSDKIFKSQLVRVFSEIVEQISKEWSSWEISKILRFIALIQPFYIDDQELISKIAQVEEIPGHDVSIILKQLSDSWIIFSRWKKYRISPDLFADYIIESSCYAGDTTTWYAERIFSLFTKNSEYAKNIVVNIWRLDWRNKLCWDWRNNIILDNFWKVLRYDQEEGTYFHNILIDLAYYQPEMAIEHCESCIRDSINVESLPKILRNISYIPEYISRAVDCLWELVKKDTRDTNPYSDHPLRILQEIITVRPNKSKDYSDIVIDKMMDYLDHFDPKWERCSPFDVLEIYMKALWEETSYLWRKISFQTFRINYDHVKSQRKKILDRACDFLWSENSITAYHAIKFIDECLRLAQSWDFPTKEAWDRERLDILEIYKKYISKIKSEINVLTVLNKVAWFRDYSSIPEEQKIAKEIIDSVQISMSMKLLIGLSDVFDEIYFWRNYNERESNRLEFVDKLSEELVATYWIWEDLYEALKVWLELLSNSNNYYAWVNIIDRKRLISKSVALRDNIIAMKDDAFMPFLALALSELYIEKKNEVINIARRKISTKDYAYLSWVWRMYSFILRETHLEDSDIEVIWSILESGNIGNIYNTIQSVNRVWKEKKKIAIDLIFKIPVDKIQDQLLISSIFPIFADGWLLDVTSLDEVDIDRILTLLLSFQKIEEFWIVELLTKILYIYPEKIFSFYLKRIENYPTEKSSEDSYSPFWYWSYAKKFFLNCPDYLWGNKIVTFNKNSLEEYFYNFLLWMNTNKDKWWHIGYFWGRLFKHFFYFDSQILNLLEDSYKNATIAELDALWIIMHNIPKDFIFTHVDFTIRIIEIISVIDQKESDRLINDLYSATVSRSKSWIPWEPFPEDLEILKSATEILSKINKFSKAWKLYNLIKIDAENSIKRSKEESELFDE